MDHLYRAVDKKGNTVDFKLSEKHDKQATEAFFEKTLKKESNPNPDKITNDGHQAYPASIKGLKKKKKLNKKTEHRVSKYLNNGIDSDHARCKQKLKPLRGFKSFACAEKTIAGWKPCSFLENASYQPENYKTEVDFGASLK